METIQNYNIIPTRVEPLPVDRGEVVTISKAELHALVDWSVQEAMGSAVSAIEKISEDTFYRIINSDAVTGKWLGTKEAAAALGKKPAQLREMVKDGRLRLGTEVRDDRPINAINPVYVFYIEKCEKRLLTLPEKRGNK